MPSQMVPAVLALLVALFQPAVAADPTTVTWKSDLLAWRAEHAKNLQQPNGWLTLIGLEWLKPGDNSVGSAKSNAAVITAPTPAALGIIKLDGNDLQLLPPKGGYPKGLVVDGKRPADPQPLVSDDPGPPSKITSASVTITVIHRGDRYGLRIKDAKAPARVQFHGLKWYAPNESYRVQAKWIPYNPPHQVPVPTILGTEIVSEVPGAAEFTLDGKTWRLEPILESPKDKDLFFIFRDTTSKSETYGTDASSIPNCPTTVSRSLARWCSTSTAPRIRHALTRRTRRVLCRCRRIAAHPDSRRAAALSRMMS